MTMTAAKRYATEQGFKHCRFIHNWMGRRVYVAYNDEPESKDNPPCIGLPTLILDYGDFCSFATPDELHDALSGHVEYYKNRKRDKIFWVDNNRSIGEWLFTFDKKTFYNMFRDYPYNLTAEQKEIFDRENPYWRKFFADRQ